MIRFLNHASFMIAHENVTLLCDPYLDGTAFDNGWSLIAQDIDYQGLDDVTHIWYSHEHPDHFSISFLMGIPESRRAGITVMYQQTHDGRIGKFLRSKGFKFQELPPGVDFQLTKDFTLQCNPIPYFDSWALIDVDGLRIVNTNDCILESPERITDVTRVTNHCDILLTQFSYANWMDNSDSSEGREELAAEKLRRIRIQSEALRPSYVIPFASFVYFSHEENAYMNDAINPPAKVVEYIDQQCVGEPMLMIPNETWDGRSPKDNAAAVQYWKEKYEEAFTKPLTTPPPSVPMDELINSCETMRKRVFECNSEILLKSLGWFGILKPLDIRLRDLDAQAVFNWSSGLVETPLSEPDTLITMHSESLNFIFSNDFGVDTINVNARFTATRAMKKRMIRTLSVLVLNNTGRFLKPSSLFKFLDRAFIIQGFRTVGFLPKPH